MSTMPMNILGFNPGSLESYLADYVERGWYVVPCHGIATDLECRAQAICTCWQGAAQRCDRPGKHPLYAWKDRPAPSLKDLMRTAESWARRWDSYRLPMNGSLNWALAVGRSGLAAIDVDQHAGGADGLHYWRGLVDDLGPLPETPRDTRGHYLFKLPAQAGGWPTAIDLAPGVELFCGSEKSSHLIHVPPSDHLSGDGYRWVVAPWEVEPAELPEAWLRHAAKVAGKRYRAAEECGRAGGRSNGGGFAGYTAADMDDERTARRVQAYLKAAGPAVQGQGGWKHTNGVAAALVKGFGLSEADAVAAILAWNHSCSPPWREAELITKIRWAAGLPGPVGEMLNRGRGGRSHGGEASAAAVGSVKLKAPCKRRRGCTSCDCGRASCAVAASQSAPKPVKQRSAYFIENGQVASRPIPSVLEFDDDFRCFNISRNIQRHKVTLMPRVQYNACDSYTCPGCGRRRRHNWRKAIATHLLGKDGPKTVWGGWVPATQFQALLDRIRRLRKKGQAGDYIAYRAERSRFFIVTNAGQVWDDLNSMTPDEAAKVLCRLITDYKGDDRDGGKDPMSSSSAWGLPKQKKDGPAEHENMGKGDPSVGDEEIEYYARLLGGRMEGRAGDRTGRIVSRSDLVMTRPITRHESEWFISLCVHGRAPDGTLAECVSGPPDDTERPIITLKTRHGERVIDLEDVESEWGAEPAPVLSL